MSPTIVSALIAAFASMVVVSANYIQYRKTNKYLKESNRKGQSLQYVTDKRMDWMHEVRNELSEMIALMLEMKDKYALYNKKIPSEEGRILNQHLMKLKLYLNFTGTLDEKIILSMDRLVMLLSVSEERDKHDNWKKQFDDNINLLLFYSQIYLKLEWERVNLEVKKEAEKIEIDRELQIKMEELFDKRIAIEQKDEMGKETILQELSWCKNINKEKKESKSVVLNESKAGIRIMTLIVFIVALFTTAVVYSLAEGLVKEVVYFIVVEIGIVTVASNYQRKKVFLKNSGKPFNAEYFEMYQGYILGYLKFGLLTYGIVFSLLYRLIKKFILLGSYNELGNMLVPFIMCFIFTAFIEIFILVKYQKFKENVTFFELYKKRKKDFTREFSEEEKLIICKNINK